MARAAFKTFAQKIAKLPAAAIIGALDRECNRLRLGLVESRGALSDHGYSVLYFKMFVRAARLGDCLDLIIRLPADEVDFFKKTTIRLVQAQALPLSALELFQLTFEVTEKVHNLSMRKELGKNAQSKHFNREQ